MLACPRLRGATWRELPVPTASNWNGALHVLLTCDAVGGVWTYALDLARGLTARGHRITLAVLGPDPDTAQRDEAAAIPSLALVAAGLSLDWIAESPAELARSGQALAALAAGVGADVVHLNSPALAVEASFPVPVLGTCHSCVKTWWTAVRGGALPADLAWRAELLGEGCGRVDALTAPTRAFALATAEAYGLERVPIVVPNGRAFPARQVGPAPQHPFVFTAGRLWDEGKNLSLLDGAAGCLPVRVLAAGPTEGPNGAAIALRHARPLGRLSPDAVASHLAVRPVFVSTALYEPFGLAVLEAAGHGCPLVISDIPTFRELWDGAAVFVDPRDGEALAAALGGLLAVEGERDRLGRLAAGRAASYGLDRMVDETVAAYERIQIGAVPRSLAS